MIQLTARRPFEGVEAGHIEHTVRGDCAYDLRVIEIRVGKVRIIGVIRQIDFDGLILRLVLHITEIGLALGIVKHERRVEDFHHVITSRGLLSVIHCFVDELVQLLEDFEVVADIDEELSRVLNDLENKQIGKNAAEVRRAQNVLYNKPGRACDHGGQEKRQDAFERVVQPHVQSFLLVEMALEVLKGNDHEGEVDEEVKVEISEERQFTSRAFDEVHVLMLCDEVEEQEGGCGGEGEEYGKVDSMRGKQRGNRLFLGRHWLGDVCLRGLVMV